MSRLNPNTDEAHDSILVLPGFKKYFANISWLMAEKLFRTALLLVVSVYVVRYLGPEQFGLLSYVMSFVTLFAALAGLGLDAVVVRELVNDETTKNEVLGTAFVLKILGACLSLLVMAAIVPFMKSNTYTILLIFVVAIGTLFRPFNIIDPYFQAKVLSKYVVFSQFGALIITSALKFLFIYLKMGLMYFAAVTLVEMLVLTLGLTFCYTRTHGSLFAWRCVYSLAKKLLKNSWPLILSGIAISVYMRIDQVMIKQMLDTEAVGHYAVAVKLSEAWYFIPAIVCTSLLPAVLNAKSKGEEFYHARLQKLYDFVTWTAIAIAVATTLIADDLVLFLYGTQFSKASSVLTIHIWGSVFFFLGVASSRWFLAENLQVLSAINITIGAVLNIVLNFILISRMGIMGAAWATIISQASALYLLNLAHGKTRGNFYRLSQSFNIFRIVRKLLSDAG